MYVTIKPEILCFLILCTAIPKKRKVIEPYFPNSQNTFALVILKIISNPTIYEVQIPAILYLFLYFKIKKILPGIIDQPHKVAKIEYSDASKPKNKCKKNKWIIYLSINLINRGIILSNVSYFR